MESGDIEKVKEKPEMVEVEVEAEEKQRHDWEQKEAEAEAPAAKETEVAAKSTALEDHKADDHSTKETKVKDEQAVATEEKAPVTVPFPAAPSVIATSTSASTSTRKRPPMLSRSDPVVARYIAMIKSNTVRITCGRAALTQSLIVVLVV